MTAFVVVNPRSGNGRTRREWKVLSRAMQATFPGFEPVFTRQRGDATALVRQALAEGCHEIIAVGGDGTINECVNGFFDENGPISPDAVFGFITSGTGGDFRKSFGIDEGAAAGLARLVSARAKPIDVGRLSCLGAGGKSVVRYFINIASFGLSGVIVDSVNRARFAKLFGGSFAFAFHSAAAMLFYRPRGVRIILDNGFDEIAQISTVAIANGQFFGGGMRVAPNASPDDGLFDVIVMGQSEKGRSLADLQQIYTGEHLKNPAVRATRAHKVVAAPIAEHRGKPVLIETDGENTGMLPATFEVLPKALNLRC
jgi:YegS/Rv2252/BmrU family lipid kinase